MVNTNGAEKPFLMLGREWFTDREQIVSNNNVPIGKNTLSC